MKGLSVRRYITCCLDCPNRQLHCHSACAEYLGERANMDEETAKRVDATNKINDAVAFIVSQCEKQTGKSAKMR